MGGSVTLAEGWAEGWEEEALAVAAALVAG
jgi:hypothetical protein